MSWTVSKLSNLPEAPPLHLPAELLDVKIILAILHSSMVVMCSPETERASLQRFPSKFLV